MSEEPTIIELADDQVAFIVGKDWGMETHIPKLGDDDNVPDYVLYVTALAMLTSNDVDFIAYVMDKFFEEYINGIGEDDN